MLEIKQDKGGVFMQEGLIHLTSDGRAVRSMSELVIAEALIAAGQDFSMENPCCLAARCAIRISQSKMRSVVARFTGSTSACSRKELPGQMGEKACLVHQEWRQARE